MQCKLDQAYMLTFRDITHALWHAIAIITTVIPVGLCFTLLFLFFISISIFFYFFHSYFCLFFFFLFHLWALIFCFTLYTPVGFSVCPKKSKERTKPVQRTLLLIYLYIEFQLKDISFQRPTQTSFLFFFFVF